MWRKHSRVSFRRDSKWGLPLTPRGPLEGGWYLRRSQSEVSQPCTHSQGQGHPGRKNPMSVGNEGPQDPEGWWLGSHTWCHTDVTLMSRRDAWKELGVRRHRLCPLGLGAGGGVEIRGQRGSLCPPSHRTSWIVVSRDEGCGDRNSLLGIPGWMPPKSGRLAPIGSSWLNSSMLSLGFHRSFEENWGTCDGRGWGCLFCFPLLPSPVPLSSKHWPSPPPSLLDT